MSLFNKLSALAALVLAVSSTYAAEPASTQLASATSSQLQVPSAPISASPVGTSTAGLSVDRSMLNDFYVNYFTNFHGPTLGRLDSPNTVNQKGEVSRAKNINFDGELTMAYLVNDDIGVGPVVPFIAVPVKGDGLILGDVGAKAFDRKTIDSGNLRVYTSLIVQAPTNAYSQKVGMDFAVKTSPNVRYVIPGSRFTLGSWTELKNYFGVTTGKTFKAWAAPYVNYQLTKSLSLNLLYEMEAHHMKGTSFFNFTSYQTDLQPGLIWFITPKVMVNPYVQLFTGNRVSQDTTAVGAILSATLL